MEIPEISMISDFKPGMRCLQNPSIISCSFGLSGIEKVPQVYSFWKWSAVIIALVATFGGIINKIKLLIFKICNVKSLASSSSSDLLQHFIDDDDYSDIDTSSSEMSEISEDEDFESTSSYEDENTQSASFENDYCVAGSSVYGERQWQNGSFNLRRRLTGGDRFSWSDFTSGKSVVKLWDSLGLSLNLTECSESLMSIWDLSENQEIDDFCGGTSQIRKVIEASPRVVFSAGVNEIDSFTLEAYDRRMRDQTPAIHAKWQPSPPQGKLLCVGSNGTDKVYVGDAVTGALTVADLRNVKTPLENGDTWWDADAVVVDK